MKLQAGDESKPFIIVGNKCDKEADRKVSFMDGQMKAEEHNAMYIEASASQNIQVETIFTKIANSILYGSSPLPPRQED